MQKKGKSKRLAGTRRVDEATPTGNLRLPFNYTMIGSPCQPLGLGGALRLRDALLGLERRLSEARVAFEADIVALLKNGGNE